MCCEKDAELDNEYSDKQDAELYDEYVEEQGIELGDGLDDYSTELNNEYVEEQDIEFENEYDDYDAESESRDSYSVSNYTFKEKLFQRLGASVSHPCSLYPCNCGDYIGGVGSDDACDNCGHRRHHHEGLT